MIAMPTEFSAEAQDVNWVKFDEYGGVEVSTREQRSRLSELAIMLREWKGSMVSVIAYGGQVSCLGEAQSRGEAVRQYLVQHGIGQDRVRVVDAGYAEEWLISIWVAPSGVALMSTESFKQAHKETAVKILDKCKIDKLTSRKRGRA